MSERIPIVLAHGFARFDALWHPLARLVDHVFPLDALFDRFHYFRNIKTHLESHGFQVFHSDVQFAARLRERASALCDNVKQICRESGADKVHIIGHSMGGMDARYAIAKFGLDKRVAVLSTIGTPHLGTSFADWGLEHLPLVAATLDRFIGIKSLPDLTTQHWEQFNRWNERIEARNDVRYRVYAGAQELERVFKPLRGAWKVVHDLEGDNDGLASMKSQLWARHLMLPTAKLSKEIEQNVIPFLLDHFNECGWWDRSESESRREFEARVKDLYLEIAAA